MRFALALLLVAPSAQALELGAHAELLGRVQLGVDFTEVHGGELVFDVAAFGVGLMLGGSYEQLEEGAAFGVLGGLQIRPATFVSAIRNRFVLPHVETGATLGAAGSGFRGAYWLGGGLEVRLSPYDKFVVGSAGYRWSAANTPDSAADHLLLFGLGFRLND